MTMEHNVHDYFDSLELYFEATVRLALICSEKIMLIGYRAVVGGERSL
jgi:hypothetical protein